MMRVLIRDGEDLIETKSFAAGPVVIGSGADCHVRLPDQRIGSEQAVLASGDDGSWVVEARDGGLPTLLNGRPIGQRAQIRHADEIGLAGFRIVLHRSDESELQETVARAKASKSASRLGDAYPLPPGSIVKTTKDTVSLPGAFPETLARLAAELRSCLDIPGLIDHALTTLLERFAGRIAFVGVRRKDYGPLEFVHGRGINGKTVDDVPLLDSFRYRGLEFAQHIFMREGTRPEIGSAIVTPLSCARGEMGLLYVDRKPGGNALGERDLDALGATAAVYAAQLETIIDNQMKVQEAVGAGELAFVREVQTSMDPTTVPQWPGLEMAVYCKPGLDSCGDVYDVMRMPNGFPALLIATIDGQGMRRATTMVEVRAAFRSAVLHADAPHLFLQTVNWMLCEDRAGCRMSGAVIVLDPTSGHMQFATAGDVGAVIVEGRGDARDLCDPNVPAAGSSPRFPFASRVDELDTGELAVLCTRGTFTVRDEQDEPLGVDRFTESARDGFGQSASIALDELVQDRSAYFKQGRQPDDITIICLRRAGMRL